MNIARFLIIYLSCLILIACSSFFYYPSREYFSDPFKFPVKPQDQFFETSDGVKIHGWYFRHVEQIVGKESAPKAKILFFHGNAQNISTHFLQLYYLLDYSFDFFIFDYRGYGRSQGLPSPAGTVEDGLAALDLILKKEPDVPLIIFGQSLGGAVALRVLQRAKQLGRDGQIKLAVIDSSFLDYREVAVDALSRNSLTWLFQPIPWMIVDNSESPSSADVEFLNYPFLVIHGNADQVVSFKHGQKIFSELRATKKFFEIKDGKHTDFLFRKSGVNRLAFVEVLNKALECGTCIKDSVVRFE